MADPLIGRVNGMETIEGRPDIVMIKVFAPKRSGTYNCDLSRVTLNGKPALEHADVDRFLTGYTRVTAEVTNPDGAREIDGVTPCDAIALIATE